MKKFKKTAAFVLACTLIATSIVGAAESTTGKTENNSEEVKCHVRITGTQEWAPRVELSISDNAADVVLGTGTEGVTAMDALVEACYYATYEKDPTIEDLETSKKIVKLMLGSTTVESGWMEGVMGDYNTDEAFWLFTDGKVSPALGIVDYVITEESDLWFYYADWVRGYRGYFDKTEYKLNSGESVEVTLIGVPLLSEMYGAYKEEPLVGTITATGKDKTYTFICDEEGKAKLENLPDGQYVLSATWEDEEYGYVLISPTAMVQVGEVVEETTTVKETTTVAETTTIVAETTAIKASPKKATINKLNNLKGKKAKITIKKINGVTGYQIKYSISKKFKDAKTVKTKKVTYTIKKLKKGKKYYVKVRAYKTVNKQRYYGPWSKVKKIKIKK